jgi:uncharacterized membrane protein YhaH (DUF805 family)
MKDLARLLFSFEGQIGRLQFWMACIVLVVLIAVLGALQALVELALPLEPGTSNVVTLTGVWLTVIPWMAISVKRFNDLGWPTWIVYALNLVGAGIWFASYIGVAPEGSAYGTLLICGNVAVDCAIFIPCAFIKGRSLAAPIISATSD